MSEPEERPLSEAEVSAAIDAVFAELARLGGDVERLPPGDRALAIVISAQGVIDNGGFRYFFGLDWSGRPPYERFADAYRTVGATAAAEALQEAARLFPFRDPHLDLEARRTFVESSAGLAFDELDREWPGVPDGILATYIAATARGSRS